MRSEWIEFYGERWLWIEFKFNFNYGCVVCSVIIVVVLVSISPELNRGEEGPVGLYRFMLRISANDGIYSSI